MMARTRSFLFVATVITTLAITSVAHGQQTPKYKANVPETVITPDRISTQLLGDLRFIDGLPEETTVRKLYDFLDVSRGAEAFLSGIPAASVYAVLEGFKEAGMNPGDIGLFEELMDARSLFLTPNSTTMYGMLEIDVKNGPVVFEAPPGVLGPVDDAYFRFVADIGVTGPDKGQGGSYLFLHRDYEGEIPDNYFVVRTPTYRNLAFFRAFVVDGDLKATAAAVKSKARSYPLSMAKNPPEQKFINLSGEKVNTIHANDFHFFEELNAVIQYEPADAFDPEISGVFASIGIKKGQPFEPDARMKKLLTEAVAIGNATARAIYFRPNLEGAYRYPDSQWYDSFVGGDYRWLRADGEGGRNMDARTLMYYHATLNTPAMVLKMIGVGSQYASCSTDSDGNYLDGSKNYKLNIPANPPAKDFWSVVVYDPQTRSELQTSQPFPSRNNKRDKLIYNDDGSVDLYYGPTAPEGKEANWTQTVPGKGWFVLFRAYGPLAPWFDKTWQPGEFELVK
jgi:hypothetical protein